MDRKAPELSQTERAILNASRAQARSAFLAGVSWLTRRINSNPGADIHDVKGAYAVADGLYPHVGED